MKTPAGGQKGGLGPLFSEAGLEPGPDIQRPPTPGGHAQLGIVSTRPDPTRPDPTIKKAPDLGAFSVMRLCVFVVALSGGEVHLP